MSVFNWMTQTKLNLNPSKTEFLLIGSEFQRKKFSHLSPYPFQFLITKQTQQIPQRDLGVLFDWIIVILYYITYQKKIQYFQNYLARVGTHALVAPSLY